ncbi:MAG TPA: PfkB family carbohydrate kinase [Gammaproteobacteria bacterium]|nr:PfkB family carbohydrate kinase [Gammaproteobacteria bacterium]
MNKFSPLLEDFKGRKVLVLGDAILDSYVMGSTDKLCREAPVPVIQVEDRHYSCGGAANTALNVKALGGEAFFLSAVGRDDAGVRLRCELSARGLDDANILPDQRRITISKKRICAYSNILLRLDDGTSGPLAEPAAELYAERLHLLYADCEAVIVSDYGYGLVSEPVMRQLAELRAERGVPLIIDAKRPLKYSALRPTAVKPNYDEMVELLGIPRLKEGRRAQIAAHGERLLELCGACYVVATLDTEGCILFERGAPPRVVPAAHVHARCSIGAGDTFVGALTLALCAGAAAETAAHIAAGAAAVVMEKEGTGVCTLGELQCWFNGNRKFVRDTATLEARVRELKAERRKIVFTNGCFDILHKGHVNFLNQARALGDILIVALNTDAGIRKLKGDHRPINSLEDRIEVLSGLSCVDYLIAFEGAGPEALLRALRPHLFVKGATYTAESVPEAELVREIGAELKIIPFVEDSTTESLLAKIRELRDAGSVGSSREAV